MERNVQADAFAVWERGVEWPEPAGEIRGEKDLGSVVMALELRSGHACLDRGAGAKNQHAEITGLALPLHHRVGTVRKGEEEHIQVRSSTVAGGSNIRIRREATRTDPQLWDLSRHPPRRAKT